MKELEKILEEIDEEIEEYRKDPEMEDVDICYGLNRAKDIIRKHMNDSQRKYTFEFDFTGVKLFDCQCGRHYVNTAGDGWIPVEDRLPEDKSVDMCLVTLENGDVCLGVYSNHDNEWYVRMSEGEIYYNNNHVVLAWMPLPEAYIPKRSEENE